VLTWDTAQSRSHIALYAMTGADCTVATDSDQSVAQNPTANLDIVANDGAVSVAIDASVSTETWAGLTERYADTVESLTRISGSSDVFGTTQTGLAIICTFSSGDSDEVGIFAAWGPSGGVVPRPQCIGCSVLGAAWGRPTGRDVPTLASARTTPPFLLQAIVCSSRERRCAALAGPRRSRHFVPRRIGLCCTRAA
jgi:hypothetical protein